MATTKAFELGDLGTELVVNADGTVSSLDVDTDAVTEGSTNLYFTTTRARDSISVSGNLTYDSGTGVLGFTMPTTIASLSNHDTDDLAEGTGNLYFTSARARASLTGGTGITYTSSTGGIEITDTGVTAGSYGSASQVPVITVNAQGQIISASTTAVAGVSSTDYNTLTGVLTINTSDGGSFTEDLGVGTGDSPSFAGGTYTADLYVSNAGPRLRLKDTDGTDQEFRVTAGAGSGYLTSQNGASYGDIYFRSNNGTTTKNIMFVDGSSSNVGVGTITPRRELHVRANGTDGWSQLLLDGDTASEIWFTEATQSDLGKLRYTHSTNAFTFITNGSTAATLDASGNLTVEGSGEFEGYLRITATGGSQRLVFGNQDSAGVNNPSIIEAANGAIFLGNGDTWSGNGGNNSRAVTIQDNGTVGIGTGTSATNARLEVIDTFAITGAQPKLRLKETDTTNDDKEILVSGGSLYIRQLNDDNTNGINLLTLNSAGSAVLAGTLEATDIITQGLVKTADGILFDNDGDFTGGNYFTIQETSGNYMRMGYNWDDDLVIASNGKVGINSPTPESKLEVIETNGSQASEYDKRIAGFYKTASNANDEGYIHLGNGDGHYGVKLGFHMEAGTPSYQNHGFYISTVYNNENITNHTKKFVVKANGNVGIGTDSPTTKFEVKGADLGSTSGNEVRHATIRGSRHHLDFDEIRTANGSDWNNTTYRLQMRVDSTNHQSIDFVSDSNYAEHIDIRTGNNLFHSRFTSNGWLGIGTTNPTAKLDVKSTDALGSVFRKNFQGTVDTYKLAATIWGEDYDGIAGSEPGPMLGFGARNDSANPNTGDVRSGIAYKYSGALTFHTSTSSVADGSGERMRIQNNGNVGVGTAVPSTKLHVYGTDPSTTIQSTSAAPILKLQAPSNQLTRIEMSDGANPIYLDSRPDFGDGLLIYENGATNTVFRGGNVGIGTTSPSATLHVDAPSTTAPSLTWGATAGQILTNENSELAIGLDNTAPYNLWMQGRQNTGNARGIMLNPLGGPVGVNTKKPIGGVDFQVNDIMLIYGNDSYTGAEISDWPTASLNIRRSDTHGSNGIRMISLGYRDDGLYQTGNAVPNLSIWDYGPGAGSLTTSTSTTELRVNSPGTVSIGTAGEDNKFIVDYDGNIALHTQTVSGLSSSAATGSIAYVSDDDGNLYYKNQLGSWQSFTAAPGTVNNPATSAQVIKAQTGTTSSGYYWIIINGVSRKIWCDMSGSTAWMLALRAQSGGSTFAYGSAYWTNTSALNDQSDPLTNTPMKQADLWVHWPVTEIRMTGSTTVSAFNANPLVFSGFSGASLQGIFSGSTNIYDSQINLGRSTWLTWAQNAIGLSPSSFDTQPNCNFDGINVDRTYQRTRLGISFNNEADCNTNDAGIGFGVYANGQTEYDCGAHTWNPNNAYSCHGWLWIR